MYHIDYAKHYAFIEAYSTDFNYRVDAPHKENNRQVLKPSTRSKCIIVFPQTKISHFHWFIHDT